MIGQPVFFEMNKYTKFLVFLAGCWIILAAAGCTFENAFPLSEYCQVDNDCTGNNVCRSGECQPRGTNVVDADDVHVNHDTGSVDDVLSTDSGSEDVTPGIDATDRDVRVEPDLGIEPDVVEPEKDAVEPEEPECVNGTIEQCVDTNNVCLSTYRSCANDKWSTCKKLSQLAGVLAVQPVGREENLIVDDVQVFLPVECDAPAGADKMTYIPAGAFFRGNDNVADQPDVAPQRAIYLTAYFIDTYEVSRSQYKACIDNQGCSKPTTTNNNNNCATQFNIPGAGVDPNKPVACVTFDMARKYCEEQGKRLVTEAEWEKAARGPVVNNENATRIYPWGNNWTYTSQGRTFRYANMLNDLIWNGRCYSNRDANDGYCLESVGTRNYALSYYGLFHMAGNVAEYVTDYYQESYYAGSPNVNPVNRVADSMNAPRVVRGGSFSEGRMEGTVFYRSVRGNPGTPVNQIGIRCAKDAP